MSADAIQIALGTLQGVLSSTAFVLFLFIGFCVLAGFTKTKKTAGGRASVVKSLDERKGHQQHRGLDRQPEQQQRQEDHAQREHQHAEQQPERQGEQEEHADPPGLGGHRRAVRIIYERRLPGVPAT